MGKKEKDKRLLRRNLLGVCVFLLALPVLWPMGGAAFAMREILPGQVSAAEPTGEGGADTTGETETVEEEPAKETGQEPFVLFFLPHGRNLLSVCK